MCKRADMMLEKCNVSSVEFRRFSIDYGKNKDKIFCFHEGKADDGVYRYFVNNLLEENKSWYCLKGKEKVIEMWKTLFDNSNYRDLKALYFVDRDFDELINNSEIYETDGYSVENYYMDEYVLENILKNEFYLDENYEGVNDEKNNYQKIITRYRELKNEFHSCVRELNIWIMYQRKQEAQFKQKRKISLNEIKNKEIFLISLGGVEKRYSLTKLENIFTDSYDFEEEVYRQVEEEFDSMDSGKYGRGKYEIAFLLKFLLIVIEELGKARKGKSNWLKNENTLKVELEIKDESEKDCNEAMKRLVTNLRIPLTLKRYLKDMNKKFCEMR